MTDLNLPAEVLDLVEFYPVEDVALTILRADLLEVPSYSLIPEDIPEAFILVRQVPDIAQWAGDEQFIDRVRFSVNTFTRDPDGDEKGALLSEAVRVVFRNASLSRRYLPGIGGILRIQMTQKPVRRTDYATSTGPVQYADLPTGMWRYEATYLVSVRRPL